MKLVLALASLLLLQAQAIAQPKVDLVPTITVIETKGGSVHLQVSPFVAKQHKIVSKKMPDYELVRSIDGGPVVGTDGTMPYTQLTAAWVIRDGRRIDLDTRWMYNAFKDSFEYSVQIRKRKDDWIIRTGLSDGAGGYCVIWTVGRESSKRKLVEEIEDCYHLGL